MCILFERSRELNKLVLAGVLCTFFVASNASSEPLDFKPVLGWSKDHNQDFVKKTATEQAMEIETHAQELRVANNADKADEVKVVSEKLSNDLIVANELFRDASSGSTGSPKIEAVKGNLEKNVPPQEIEKLVNDLMDISSGLYSLGNAIAS